MVTKAQFNGFIEYLEEQRENHSIYVWGAQGQIFPVLTEEWIKSKENGISLKNALKTYRAAKVAGFGTKTRAFDCSGLAMYYLQNITNIFATDKNANGLMGECTKIQATHLKKGDFVFRTYRNTSKKGRAYHIGYVVDDEMNIIHAKGRAYGVVKEKFNSKYWNVCGRPSFFAAYIDTKDEIADHKAFSRLLKKGCKGDDVKELQELLNKAGDNIKVDGDFGSKTLAAVKEIQRKKKLKADGIAGKQTITALGGKWEGK